MSGLNIFLFGAPRLEKDGQSVPLGRSKALALLAYLCLDKGMQTRDALIELLWPTFAPEDARNNLRRELSLLKGTLPESALLADRQAIGIDPQAWVDSRLTADVRAFEEKVDGALNHAHPNGILCDTCADLLETAAALYTADFLAGFSLPDSPTFDEWQFYQADRLRRSLAVVLARLAEWYGDREEFERALAHARRWAALDPLHEPAHRTLMQLHWAAGQHAAALRVYENLRRFLREELGIDPDPTTTELYEAIRARRPSPGAAVKPAITERIQEIVLPPNNLPADTTPFIGRVRELAQIDALLADPSARLITILGIGGMGKTRVALAAARRVANSPAAVVSFPDGVFFAALAPLTKTADIAPALALSLGFTPGGEAQPEHQLIDYLRSRKLLLLVDNFEHLIDQESVRLFADMLGAAPGVKLLTTSRVRLGLGGEQLFPLDGLDLPAPDASPDGSANGHMAHGTAVALFAEAARRVQPLFRIDKTNINAVTRICRLVGGMPLGIELAAGWMELLTPEAILTEVERSLDFLESGHADTPARQASLKAVFDSSWNLLTTEEQATLPRLTVFKGGFNRSAAEAVAGATMKTLLRLANKSWIQPVGNDRYQIHELLRQYAAQVLAEDPHAEEVVRERYALHFAAYLAQLDEQMRGPQPSTAFDAVTADLDNVRAAMAWLIAHDRLNPLTEQMALPLLRYLESRYRYFLFHPLITAASRKAETAGMVRVRRILLTVRVAFFTNGFPTRFMDYHWVETFWQNLLREAWGLAATEPAAPDFWSILLAWQYGHFVGEEGVNRLRELLPELEGSDQRWNEAFARQSLGRLLEHRPWDVARFGRPGEAAELLESAQAAFKALGDEREAAFSLVFLGFERQLEGDMVKAKRLLEEGQERLRALGEDIIAANLNWQLAEIHLQLGEVDASFSYLREMADLLLKSGRAHLAVSGMSRESYEAVRYGDLDYALRVRERSMALSRETGHRYTEAWDCWEMGEIYRVMGHPEEARRWYERSRAIFQEINDNAGTTFYFRGLGDLALAEADYGAAEAHYRDSIRWAVQTNHLWQHAYSLARLGSALSAAGRPDEARGHLAQALRVGHLTGDPGGVTLLAIVSAAEFYDRTGEKEKAVELARLVLAHSLSWRETRLQAAKLLGLSPESIPPRPNDRPFDLTPAVEGLIAELEA